MERERERERVRWRGVGESTNTYVQSRYPIKTGHHSMEKDMERGEGALGTSLSLALSLGDLGTGMGQR